MVVIRHWILRLSGALQLVSVYEDDPGLTMDLCGSYEGPVLGWGSVPWILLGQEILTLCVCVAVRGTQTGALPDVVAEEMRTLFV